MPRKFGSPNMSDNTLLVSVEDLINMAMGPPDKNVVNFKLIQTVLHILARQMRLLEQRVEIRVTDERERRVNEEEDRRSRSQERAQRDSKKQERQTKDRDRADKAASKERDKADRAKSKERDKAERAEARAQERADRASSKERDRAEREAQRGDRAASREREKAEREAQKKERATSKEREKAEKAAAKDRERADRAESKERDKGAKGSSRDKSERGSKERERAERDQDREDRAGSRERDRERDERSGAKGTGKAERESGREREKTDRYADKGKEAEYEAARDKKGKKGKVYSDTSIVVSEVERRKEKVLVVEKGPTTRYDKNRGSIEVVTRSQFDIVEALVRNLQQRSGPPPAPKLPANKQLMSDLARGQASLTDTMQAMQVTARVRAAEQAISRMGDLLTQLAAAGALPGDVADQLGDMRFEPPDADVATLTALPTKTRSTVSRKSVAIDPLSAPSDLMVEMRTLGPTAGGSASAQSRRASSASRASVQAGALPVSHPEMDDAIRSLREDLRKCVTTMTSKSTAIAESASASARAAADKLDIAMKINSRISTLFSLTTDYAEQLTGFDAGLTTQMASFKDQMAQMRSELKGGLKQLDQVNNNAETAAVLELTERYKGLVSELDTTLHAHRALTSAQRTLGDELHSLVECVEMLREQKADRDEVLDGLRDKADNTRLAGLLTTTEFAAARGELEARLGVCHDKFRRQENVWMTALKDLTNITENKAEITQLLAAREQAEMMLRELQDKQMKLAVILGEPKAAMLTRALARGASCGACLAPALMEPQDQSYGAPPPLPALRQRPRPVGEEDPCEQPWKPPEPPDNREHTCHRWVGGSHTLLSDAVTRERAPPLQLLTAPTKRYTGYGDDGRLYMLEEELQPCVECNKFSEPPAPPEQGAGDLAPPPPPAE